MSSGDDLPGALTRSNGGLGDVRGDGRKVQRWECVTRAAQTCHKLAPPSDQSVWTASTHRAVGHSKGVTS